MFLFFYKTSFILNFIRQFDMLCLGRVLAVGWGITTAAAAEEACLSALDVLVREIQVRTYIDGILHEKHMCIIQFSLIIYHEKSLKNGRNELSLLMQFSVTISTLYYTFICIIFDYENNRNNSHNYNDNNNYNICNNDNSNSNSNSNNDDNDNNDTYDHNNDNTNNNYNNYNVNNKNSKFIVSLILSLFIA